jgi:hypothetical protein
MRLKMAKWRIIFYGTWFTISTLAAVLFTSLAVHSYMAIDFFLPGTNDHAYWYFYSNQGQVYFHYNRDRADGTFLNGQILYRGLRFNRSTGYTQISYIYRDGPGRGKPAVWSSIPPPPYFIRCPIPLSILVLSISEMSLLLLVIAFRLAHWTTIGDMHPY